MVKSITKEAGIPDWGGRLYTRVNEALASVPGNPTPLPAANLPLPTAALLGSRGFVSDATATTFDSIVAGGGTHPVPVFCDGSVWRIG